MFLQNFPFIPYLLAFIPLYLATFSLIGLSLNLFVDNTMYSDKSIQRLIFFSSHSHLNLSLLCVPFCFLLINLKLELDSLDQNSIIVLPQVYYYIAWLIASLPLYITYTTLLFVFLKEEVYIKVFKEKRQFDWIPLMVVLSLLFALTAITIFITLYLQIKDAFPDRSPPFPAYVAFLPLWISEIIFFSIIFIMLCRILFKNKESIFFRFGMASLLISSALFFVSHVLSAIFSLVNLEVGYGIDFSKSLPIIPIIPALLFLFLFFIFAFK